MKEQERKASLVRDCLLEPSSPASLHQSQKNTQSFLKQRPLPWAKHISLWGKGWAREQQGRRSFLGILCPLPGPEACRTRRLAHGSQARGRSQGPSQPRRAAPSCVPPGAPHLLVPVLAVLVHLRLEDGLLALGAPGQEQQAVRLMEGQVGRGHPSFAARGRG